MNQTRKSSALESGTNIVVGLLLAFFLQLLVFPLFGFHPTLTQNLTILLIFTFVSFIRSYVIRRIFNQYV